MLRCFRSFINVTKKEYLSCLILLNAITRFELRGIYILIGYKQKVEVFLEFRIKTLNVVLFRRIHLSQGLV